MMRLTCDSSYAASDFPTLSDSKSSVNIIVSSVGTISQILYKQTQLNSCGPRTGSSSMTLVIMSFCGENRPCIPSLCFLTFK